jgi:D-3-phosphoglycerate dehydrogenase
MEVIDLPYAASKGITCFSSPGGNCNAVGEHALGMLLCLNKRIAVSREQIGQGKWLREENRGTELEGKTIGIIGFGHTGRAFAHKLQGMDMRILAYDKYSLEGIPSGVIPCTSLDPVFREAEIISFHVPIRTETRHYFNVTFLRQMQQRFILINTSRGEVVDISSVWDGLESGRIRGACLDVWEEEPLEKMSGGQRDYLERMVKRPDTIITPHIAGYTHEALYKMSRILLDKIIIMK